MSNMEKFGTFPVICQGGLDSNKNHIFLSQQSPGAATTLLNFEPSLFGGYRRLDGFEPLESAHAEVDATGAEAEILGIHIFKTGIIVNRKTKAPAVTYKHYYWTSGADWTAYTTGLTLTATNVVKIRSVSYNFDGDDHIMFVDGVNHLTIYNGSAWIDAGSGDTGADFAHAGGDQLINTPSLITTFRNHIFVSGDATDPNLVVHCAPQEDFDWTVAGGAGQINAGFAVKQIKPFRDELFIFGATKIKKIVVDGTDFVLKDVSNNGGLLAADSVVEINGDLLFLAADGIRTIAGTIQNIDVELGCVSKRIQQDITDLISSADFNAVNAVVVRKKSQVRFFFSDENLDTDANNGIIGGLKGDPGSVYWEWGLLRGIRASCVTSGYIGSAEYVLHGDYNGKVYRQERGNDFDGANILSVYTTPYFDFGDVFVRKSIHKIIVFIRPEDTIQLSAALKYDWESLDVSNPTNYLLEADVVASTYDSGVEYDDVGVTYASNPAPLLIQNVEGSGFSVSMTLTSDDMNGAYSVQAIMFEYAPNGRK